MTLSAYAAYLGGNLLSLGKLPSNYVLAPKAGVGGPEKEMKVVGIDCAEAGVPGRAEMHRAGGSEKEVLRKTPVFKKGSL